MLSDRVQTKAQTISMKLLWLKNENRLNEQRRKEKDKNLHLNDELLYKTNN